METWKDIEEYKGLYKVSNNGLVKRLTNKVRKSNGVILSVKEKILKCSNHAGGYLSVRLSKNGKTRQFLIHVLVWEAFGNYKKNLHMHIDHINENKKDNNIKNLQLLSHRQNNIKTLRLKNKFTGVSFDKKRNKYSAYIYIHGKAKYLGRFDSKEEAYNAYIKRLSEIEPLYLNYEI